MIPHTLIGRFIYIRPKMAALGATFRGRVFLLHINPDGTLVAVSLKDKGLVFLHRFQQASYDVYASKRDDAATEEIIRVLNTELAKDGTIFVNRRDVEDVRDLMVGFLEANVKADVEAAREEEDQIIQARFHELGQPTPQGACPFGSDDCDCGQDCDPEPEDEEPVQVVFIIRDVVPSETLRELVKQELYRLMYGG